MVTKNRARRFVLADRAVTVCTPIVDPTLYVPVRVCMTPEKQPIISVTESWLGVFASLECYKT